MKSKAPPLDVDALVQQLGEGSAPSAQASASDLIRSWFQWRAPGAGAAARRTLLHVAAAHGSVPALRCLLELGADPNAAGPDDGATPMHCACHARGETLSEVLTVLLEAGADKELRDSLGRRPVDLLLAQTRPGDLDKEEYRTDEFRMFGFKIQQCSNEEPHDWTECPFAHTGEKARRRDPRVYNYTGVACPDFRKGICKRGDECTYGHGVFECWLHPSRYRTQLCKDGTDCNRRVCFFAHEPTELRASDLASDDKSDAASDCGEEARSPRGCGGGALSLSRCSSSSDAVTPTAAAGDAGATGNAAAGTPAACPKGGAAGAPASLAAGGAAKKAAPATVVAAATVLMPRGPGVQSDGSTAPNSSCGTPTRCGSGAAAAAASPAPALLQAAAATPAAARKGAAAAGAGVGPLHGDNASAASSLLAAYAASCAAAAAGPAPGAAAARGSPLPPQPPAGSCHLSSADPPMPLFDRRPSAGLLLGSSSPSAAWPGLDLPPFGARHRADSASSGSLLGAAGGGGGAAVSCGLGLRALSLDGAGLPRSSGLQLGGLSAAGAHHAPSAPSPLEFATQADAAAASWLLLQQQQQHLQQQQRLQQQHLQQQHLQQQHQQQLAVQAAGAAAAAAWHQQMGQLQPLALAQLQQEQRQLQQHLQLLAVASSGGFPSLGLL